MFSTRPRVIRLVQVWIESERAKTQKEREEKEQSILAQKLGGLDMSHRRRYALYSSGKAVIDIASPFFDSSLYV